MNSGQIDIAAARKARYDVPSWDNLKVDKDGTEPLVRGIAPFLRAFAANELKGQMGNGAAGIKKELESQRQWSPDVESNADDLVGKLKNASFSAFREGRGRLAAEQDGGELLQKAKNLALHQAQLVFCALCCDIQSVALKIDKKMEDGARLESLNASVNKLWKFVDLLAGTGDRYFQMVEKLLKENGSEGFLGWLRNEELL